MQRKLHGFFVAVKSSVDINKIAYAIEMNSREFKRWLAQQGATFGTMRGSHLKVYLNGKQSILPMHNTELKTGLVRALRSSWV